MTRHTRGLAIFSRYADGGLRQSIEHTARATYSFGINGIFEDLGRYLRIIRVVTRLAL